MKQSVVLSCEITMPNDMNYSGFTKCENVVGYDHYSLPFTVFYCIYRKIIPISFFGII